MVGLWGACMVPSYSSTQALFGTHAIPYGIQPIPSWIHIQYPYGIQPIPSWVHIQYPYGIQPIPSWVHIQYPVRCSTYTLRLIPRV